MPFRAGEKTKFPGERGYLVMFELTCRLFYGTIKASSQSKCDGNFKIKLMSL